MRSHIPLLWGQNHSNATLKQSIRSHLVRVNQSSIGDVGGVTPMSTMVDGDVSL